MRALNQPEASPRDFGAGIGTALVGLGEELQGLQETAKPIEAAKAASEYDIWAEDKKNEIETLEDPNTWHSTFLKEEAQFYKQQGESIESTAVKGANELHRTKALPRHMKDLNDRAMKRTKDKQKADLEVTSSVLAKQAAQTDDPELRSSYMSTFNAMIAGASQPTAIGGRPVPGALTAEEAATRREKWNVDVLKNRMEMLAVSQNPADFTKLNNEHASGAYNIVPGDERARILERGRTHQEALYNSVERQKNVAKEIANNDASAQANFGLLSDDWLRRAMNNENPLIGPVRAKELKSVNDNPPGAEGNDSVRAIMTKYALGDPTLDRIRTARRELNSLQGQSGRSSEALKDAGLKLQSDERGLESINVQRSNQRVTAATEIYDATKPIIPFSSPMFQNMEKRDRASVRNKAREGMDPKAAAETKVKQSQERLNNIPERQKKVLELK